MLEMGLAIIIACLPVLQSLVRKTWPFSPLQVIRRFPSRRLAGFSGSRVFRFQSLEDGYSPSQVELTKTQAP